MENKEGKVVMQKYEVGSFLGQGSFAKVYYARNIETSQSVAIKVIEKDQITNLGMVDQIKREISAMRKVKHPNILEIYEVIASKTKIYIVMEYAKGGELFAKVAKGKLRERVGRKYFQQLISAVDFCHSRGVYHRDLKLENLLLDENGDLKVSDFGLSAFAESRHQDGLLHTVCGTPAYLAPEIIQKKGYDGAKTDIWSCGVILYVLLAGFPPFYSPSLAEMYMKICKGEYRFPLWFSTETQKLLTRILNPNPYSRISIARIMENPWFKRGLNNSQPVEPKAEKEFVRHTHLNAFDIISLSSGLDLSTLFAESITHVKKEVQFTSMHTVSAITSKLEDVAKSLKLKIKMFGGLLKMEGSSNGGGGGGRKGALVIDAEIFEFTPSFHLVELRKSNGDTMEFRKMLQENVRPALKDIVWSWQGEQQLQLQ